MPNILKSRLYRRHSPTFLSFMRLSFLALRSISYLSGFFGIMSVNSSDYNKLIKSWSNDPEILACVLPKEKASEAKSRSPQELVREALQSLKELKFDKLKNDEDQALKELRREYAVLINSKGYKKICAFEDCGKENTVEGTALKICAGCGVEFYCSKEHQRAHWGTHKLICVTK